MLGLRRAHQAPHRGAGQIGDVLARQGDRAAGRHDQRRRSRARRARTAAPPGRRGCGVYDRCQTGRRPRAADSNTSYGGRLAVRSGSAAGSQTTSKNSVGHRPPIPRPPTAAASPDGPPSTPPTTPAGPAPSARSIDIDVRVAVGPDGAIRARTDDAPAACNDTFCQENGSAICVRPSSAAVATTTACSARVQQRRVHTEPGRRLPASLGQATPRRTPRRRGATSPSAPGTPDRTRSHAPASRRRRPRRRPRVAPAGGQTDRSVPGAAAPAPQLRPRRAASSRQSPSRAGEHRHRRGRLIRRHAPTTTCTATPAGPAAPAARAASTRRRPCSRPRRRRGWPTRRSPRPGTAPHRRPRDRSARAAIAARQPARQHHAARASGEFHHRTEQRVLAAPARPKTPASEPAPSAGQPKPAPLKRIRRQLDERPAAAQHRAPAPRRRPTRQACASAGGRPSARDGPCAASARTRVRVGQRLLDRRRQAAAGPTSRNRVDAGRIRVADAVGEPDRLADVLRPSSPSRRSRRRASSPVTLEMTGMLPAPTVIPRCRGGEFAEHRLHQRRVERMRHGELVHAAALGAQPVRERRRPGLIGTGDRRRTSVR